MVPNGSSISIHSKLTLMP
uniref:Uncharacterized protein n=1 Tax=Anguilla anguilla TaxID=7936 RepID=A0A0E9VW15_ANGAN